MTVKASARDADGVLLQANITALSTAVTAAVGKPHYAALSAQLDQLQRECVAHFMDVNRITAANILSTLS